MKEATGRGVGGGDRATSGNAGRTWLVPTPWAGALAVIVAASAMTAAVNSCTSANRTIVAPPEIAGAEFVGSEDCEACHPAIVEKFQTATHALLMAEGENAIGCEGCHGPASLHLESAGERDKIVNPANSPELCFRCHLDKRGDFSLPHTHPVTGGPLGIGTAKVSCTDCHQLHEGPAIPGGGTSIASESEVCLECHVAQRGPWVFEHEALREGCMACHAPHGSVNEKMLTERDASLCLKCHFQEQTPVGGIFIGGWEHSGPLMRGACFSAGCHEAVHGSNVNSSLRF